MWRTGCRSDIFYDGYRESWAVIRGRVLDQADRPIAGASIRAVSVQPLYARGDSVTSAAERDRGGKPDTLVVLRVRP